MSIYICAAQTEDYARMRAIYAPYVEKSAATFEYELPDEKSWQVRISSIAANYPVLIAKNDKNDQMLGYTYLSAWNSRFAARFSCETSIYVAESARGQGVGKLLYQKLECLARVLGYTHLAARITYPSEAMLAGEIKDSHVSSASVDFHEAMGWQRVGLLHGCGFKFGQWYDLMWMEKELIDSKNYKNPQVSEVDAWRDRVSSCGIFEGRASCLTH